MRIKKEKKEKKEWSQSVCLVLSFFTIYGVITTVKKGFSELIRLRLNNFFVSIVFFNFVSRARLTIDYHVENKKQRFIFSTRRIETFFNAYLPLAKTLYA
jgi:hypothetical protein